jgi:hypothetical protein
MREKNPLPPIGDNEIDSMERTINLPDDLFAQIEGTVAQQGKSVDQWIEESLRAQLEERSWRDLLAYGLATGRESGYSESEVPDLVKQWRREQLSR